MLSNLILNDGIVEKTIKFFLKKTNIKKNNGAKF